MHKPLDFIEVGPLIRIEYGNYKRFFISKHSWDDFLGIIRSSEIPEEFNFSSDLKLVYENYKLSFKALSQLGYFDILLELDTAQSQALIQQILGCKHETLSD